MKKAKQGSTGDYAIGYRRPPRQHRFKKGQSGNLRGRPKKGRRRPESWEDVFLRVAGEMIPATTKGKRVMITKWQALVERVFNEGASGDTKARDLALQFLPYVGNGDGGVIYQEVPDQLLLA
jgi:hypothetical protein